MSVVRKQKGNQTSSPKRQTSTKKGNSLAPKNKKQLESAAEISTTETDDRTPKSPKAEDKIISGDTKPDSADDKNVDESTIAELKQSDHKNVESDMKLDNTTLDATKLESAAEISKTGTDDRTAESPKIEDKTTSGDIKFESAAEISTTETDDRTPESPKVEDKIISGGTKLESTDDKNEDESTRAQIKQSDDKNVESDMKIDNTTLNATEATGENTGTNENEIPIKHSEPSQAVNESEPESSVIERGEFSSPVQKNEEQRKNYNGEDNENNELIETISKKAPEISTFTEKSDAKKAPEISTFTEKTDEKERESLLQNAPVSDVEIVIKDGAIDIIMVQNGDRNSHQKYSLKVKGIYSNENDFHSQNVVSRSIVEKDSQEKKTCQKCELANKQSIEIVKEKDNDKIKITKDLKKEENGDSEIKQEELSIPEKKYLDVADREEKIITANDELINQPIKESINTVGEEGRNIVTNEMVNRVDPEKEQAELRSPEKQLVQDVYTESEQVNEPNKESNGFVGGEKGDNRTNGTLEKGDPEMKEEGPSSLEKKKPGVLDGKENVSDPGNQPNIDSNIKVGKEETNKKINESLNTEDTDMDQEKNVSPVYRQLGIQNGGNIVNKASELSIIKTELQKEYALNDGVMDEEGSICSNASWNEIDPLRFHTVHGANIRLSADGFVAQRHKLSSFFGKGIVFSSRPVGIGEKICIRFEEISNYWLGFMTFGFTNHDPETLACDLPGIAVTDLDKKPGFWAGHLAKTFCNKGNIFHYFVNSSGNVNFGINGIDKGTLFWNVDTTKPIWALSDLFGYFTAISLIDPRIPIETRSFTPYKENKDSRITSWITTSLHPSLKYQKGIKLLPMNLHSTKGMNVQMLNFKGVVARSDDTNQGYIFTERPMNLGQTIVIQVLASGPGYEYLPIGFTCNDPTTVNPRELPDNAEDLAEWGQNWVLIKNIANFVQHGDEIAVTRTVDGDIRLRRNNGESITVARFSRAQKFWAFVDIFGAIQMLRVWTTKRPCPCVRQTSKSMFN